MKFSLYLDDHETEKIFTYLRWIFLCLAVVLFYVPIFQKNLHFNLTSFPVLLAIGTLYMTCTQVCLYRMDSKSAWFSIILKAGIVFDYVSLGWLLVLSGGISSPLFPITYLLVMHATLYWRTKGAFLSSLLASLGYACLLVFEKHITLEVMVLFCLNLCFIWIVGLFGSFIVLRERKHFRQKEIFHEWMITDYLTGLYNHRSFQEELDQSLINTNHGVLVMGDIDHFKKINDMGHMIGDEVLRRIGGLLSELVANHDGKAFRYGGEEFAFIFKKSKQPHLHPFFEELFESLNNLAYSVDYLHVTMSFGVVYFSSCCTRDEALSRADQLLYKAKNNGKAQAVFEDGFVYQFPNNIRFSAISV